MNMLQANCTVGAFSTKCERCIKFPFYIGQYRFYWLILSYDLFIYSIQPFSHFGSDFYIHFIGFN